MKKYIKAILCAFYLFMLFVYSIDLCTFILSPSEYPIGDGMQWCYRTASNYLLSSIFFIIWIIIGLLLLLRYYKKLIILGHIIITLIFIL